MFANDGFEWRRMDLPRTPQKMIYIVAGDMKQAKQWAREHGIAPPYWRAVLAPVDIEGARDSVFVRIGTFYQREKASEIRDLLNLYENNGYLREIKDE